MTNQDLVEELRSGGYLKNPALVEAFEAIDRKDFVPSELKDSAYENTALPIGYGQTISQPLVVAFMLELLDPQPNEKILDIGVGSGWQLALLTHIAFRNVSDIGEVIEPKVMGMERIPELKAMAESNLEKYGYIQKKWVEVVLGDASEGMPADLLPAYGFNKIIAAASVEGDVPLAWKRQLAVNGRIVAPVGTSIVMYEKKAGDTFVRKEYPGFMFVPLVKD